MERFKPSFRNNLKHDKERANNPTYNDYPNRMNIKISVYTNIIL